MAPPILTITDEFDVLIDAGNPLPIANAPPGVTTPVGIVRVQNAPAVDDAIGYGLLSQARRTGTGDEFANSGLEVLDTRALRVSISPASPHGAPTSPKGLGGGVVQRLPDIPAGSFVELDVEIKLAANVNVTDLDITLVPEKVVSSQIGEAHPNGLVTLLGNGSVSYVAETDGPVTVASPPDDTVLLPDATIVAQGVQIFEAAEALAFDDQDGSAQTLAPGEEYAALISYGFDVDGVKRVVTKGDKSAGAPTVPATPTGHLERTVVIVPEGLVILTVTNLLTEGNFLATFGGFDLTMSGGFANADGHRVTPQTPTVINFSAFPSADTDLYVDLAGNFLQTPRGTPLTGAPLPLWRAITDGVAITEIQDLRAFADQGYS